MNSLGNCPHCGAPITTNIKITGRVTTCEYCGSQFIIPQEIFSSIVHHKNAQMQVNSTTTIAPTIKNSKEKTSLGGHLIKCIIATLTIPFGGGAFGITSFICGRPILGIICFIITMHWANTDAEFGFMPLLSMILIPIFSILFAKRK